MPTTKFDSRQPRTSAPERAGGSGHVEAWVSRMEDEGLSGSRIRQAFNVLAAMLDAAIANDMIARDVARGVDLPRLIPSKRRFLTQEQVWALAEAIDARCRVLVVVLAYSGMR